MLDNCFKAVLNDTGLSTNPKKLDLLSKKIDQISLMQTV